MARISEVPTVVDQKRGCGWRKPGGLYLMAGGQGVDCGALPKVLDVCECCGGGIKPVRGWTTVNPRMLFFGPGPDRSPDVCRQECGMPRVSCPLQVEKAGLLWIGGSHYPTPKAWLDEARTQGMSRRIPTVPRNFEVGKDWLLIAHRQYRIEVDGDGDEKKIRAIFHVCKPDRIEYVCRGDETDAELEKLEKRGVTPVRVEHADEPADPQGSLI